MKSVLTIAGTDPAGGAGIAADLKAFASMDMHGACVVTAVTSQNTCQVRDIFPVGPQAVSAQLDAVFDDLEIGAVKTGMLYSAEMVKAVAEKVGKEKVPLVVDPVLKAGVGSPLHKNDLVEALVSRLLPLATVVTPNRMEAEALTAMSIASMDDAEEACRAIVGAGATSALVKGGHFDGAVSTDLLLHEDKFTEFVSPRLNVKVHGSGCTLSSYIAAYLAQGYDVPASVAGSKRRIYDAIALAIEVGQGMAVINPMATKQKETLRYQNSTAAVRAVDLMVSDSIQKRRFSREISLSYALPNPQDLSEIYTVTFSGAPDEGFSSAGSDYGLQTENAWTLLRMTDVSRTVLAAARIDVNEEELELLGKAGLRIEGRPQDHRNAEPDVIDYVKQLGFVPDAILTGIGMGKEPKLLIFGKDPEDILHKVGPTLG